MKKIIVVSLTLALCLQPLTLALAQSQPASPSDLNFLQQLVLTTSFVKGALLVGIWTPFTRDLPGTGRIQIRNGGTFRQFIPGEILGYCLYTLISEVFPRGRYPIRAMSNNEAFLDLNNDELKQEDEPYFFLNGDNRLDFEPRRLNPFGVALAIPAFFCFQFVAGLLIPVGTAGFLMNVAWETPDTGLAFNKVFRFFTYAIPFFALGTVLLGSSAAEAQGAPASLSITTSIVANNPTGAPIQGTLVFLDPEGAALDGLELAGETGNVFEFEVPASSSLTLTPELANQTAGSASLVRGSAFGIGANLEFSALYETVENSPSNAGAGGILPTGVVQAGLAAVTGATRHVLSINRDGAKDTSIAISNFTSITANMTLELLDQQGQSVAQRPLILPPFGSDAFFPIAFVTETPASVELQGELDPFQGSLVITSDSDVTVISLQTLQGFQLSSLPGGTLQIQ